MNLPPDIPPIPDEIKNAVKSGTLVLFIGAGVSRRVGGPSWGELADQFLGQLAHQPTSRVSFGDLQQLRAEHPKKKISIASNIWRRDCVVGPDFKKIIQPNFDRSKIPAIYRNLYKINACNVTTNYDEWLDILAKDRTLSLLHLPIIGAPDEGQSDPVVTQSKSQFVFYEKEDLTREKLLKQGAVIHLHGSVEKPTSMILSTRDYLEHYQHEFVKGFLEKLFCGEFAVLFIGYGVEEDEILEFVIRKRPVGQERKFFRLYPLYAHQMGIFQHIDNYSRTHCDVHLLPYSSEKKGDAQLDLVIEHWSKVLRESARPTSVYRKLGVLDEAFDE